MSSQLGNTLNSSSDDLPVAISSAAGTCRLSSFAAVGRGALIPVNLDRLSVVCVTETVGLASTARLPPLLLVAVREAAWIDAFLATGRAAASLGGCTRRVVAAADGVAELEDFG